MVVSKDPPALPVPPGLLVLIRLFPALPGRRAILVLMERQAPLAPRALIRRSLARRVIRVRRVPTVLMVLRVTLVILAFGVRTAPLVPPAQPVPRVVTVMSAPLVPPDLPV